MAYYLKKTKLKGRTYLSIDESFYSDEKKGTAHRCYKSLKSVETWQKQGIEDPIAYFQKEVDELNQKRADEGVKKISDIPPELCLGYFPLKALMEKLCIQKYTDIFSTANNCSFSLYEVLSSVIYADAVHSCSEGRTFYASLRNLYEPVNYSCDQLMDGLEFIGNNYEKFVELFTVQTNKIFGLDTSETYFVYMTFRFADGQAEKPDNSPDESCGSQTGVGLLLDRNMIPAGMLLSDVRKDDEISEKDIIAKIRKRYSISGKTVPLADNARGTEKYFRDMKNNMDPGSVLCADENIIKAHFLVCYFAVLLERVLKVFVLDNKYNDDEIFRFFREFNVIRGENKFINTAAYNDFISDYSEITKLPLTNYFLTEKQISKILKYKMTV